MKKEEMICIVCPIGCHLEIEIDDNDTIMEVTGGQCPRGEVYARKELTNPTRMLTSTVRIVGAMYERLPVITSQDIPKGKMFDVMKEIAKVTVEAPVVNKQIIIENVCGLGVDIIASRSMAKIN
jgi:CxxC motif-containing protein